MKLTVGEGVPPYAAQILRDIHVRLATRHGWMLEGRHHAHVSVKRLVDEMWDAVYKLSEAVENKDDGLADVAATLVKCIVVVLDAHATRPGGTR